MTHRDTFLNTKTAKIYNDHTLIGNWFENRAVKEKSPLIAQQQSESEFTEYTENYAKALKDADLNEVFTSSYVQAFRNRARGHQSSVKLFNADQFLANLTSSSDIYYRIKAGRNNCGQLVKEPVSTLDFDPVRSFGNATNFGLRKWIRKREEEFQNVPTDMSLTRDIYKCPRKGDYARVIKK